MTGKDRQEYGLQFSEQSNWYHTEQVQNVTDRALISVQSVALNYIEYACPSMKIYYFPINRSVHDQYHCEI
jgi:hypothetical protein